MCNHMKNNLMAGNVNKSNLIEGECSDKILKQVSDVTQIVSQYKTASSSRNNAPSVLDLIITRLKTSISKLLKLTTSSNHDNNVNEESIILDEIIASGLLLRSLIEYGEGFLCRKNLIKINHEIHEIPIFLIVDCIIALFKTAETKFGHHQTFFSGKNLNERNNNQNTVKENNQNTILQSCGSNDAGDNNTKLNYKLSTSEMEFYLGITPFLAAIKTLLNCIVTAFEYWDILEGSLLEGYKKMEALMLKLFVSHTKFNDFFILRWLLMPEELTKFMKWFFLNNYESEARLGKKGGRNHNFNDSNDDVTNNSSISLMGSIVQTCLRFSIMYNDIYTQCLLDETKENSPKQLNIKNKKTEAANLIEYLTLRGVLEVDEEEMTTLDGHTNNFDTVVFSKLSSYGLTFWTAEKSLSKIINLTKNLIEVYLHSGTEVSSLLSVDSLSNILIQSVLVTCEDNYSFMYRTEESSKIAISTIGLIEKTTLAPRLFNGVQSQPLLTQLHKILYNGNILHPNLKKKIRKTALMVQHSLLRYKGHDLVHWRSLAPNDLKKFAISKKREYQKKNADELINNRKKSKLEIELEKLNTTENRTDETDEGTIRDEVDEGTKRDEEDGGTKRDEEDGGTGDRNDLVHDNNNNNNNNNNNSILVEQLEQSSDSSDSGINLEDVMNELKETINE